MELAQKRARALFRTIVLKFPAVGDRVIVAKGYNFEDTFFDSTTIYDPRVEIEIKFRDFKERKFYPRERVPYWRASYKNVIKDIRPQLEKIFTHNPQVNAIIIGNGLPPNRDGYKWLGFLKKKIIERLGERFNNRIGVFVNPFAKDENPSGKLILLPVINSAGVDSILWNKPSIRCPVSCSVDGVQPVPNRFFGTSIFDNVFQATMIEIKSESMNIDMNELTILPQQFKLDFHFPKLGISVNSPDLEIEMADSFDGLWKFEIWKPNFLEYIDFTGYGMWRVATAIYCISQIADESKITITASTMDDSSTQSEAEMVWDILATQVCFITDTNKDKLGSWFEKNNINVELSPSSEIDIHDGNPFDKNTVNVIIHFWRRNN
ncbi:hypothetical protein DRQ33_03635 [bacterium]|nr:MAG: hypothetical protein DRQ33_03635 [bacterium]